MMEKWAQVSELIAQKKFYELKELISELLPFDITELIDPLETSEKVIVFRLLNKETAAEVFSLQDHEDQEALLSHFSKDTVKEIIEKMDPDDVAELFDELPDEMVKRLMRFLAAEDRKLINKLLGYPEDSAGRLMTPEFIELNKNSSVDVAIQTIRKIGINKETIYYAYVTERGGFLIGIVSLRDLLLAEPDTLISDIMTTNIVSVNTTDDQEEVAGVLTDYDLSAIPVVDNDNKLVGIITIDDVVDVIHEEATEDFHKMAGIEAPDDPYFNTNFFVLGRKRAIWLVILLIMSYLSSAVLKHYSHVLEIVIPLAFFIPMLTGTCGNTGMQSATLIIRGLATGEIKLQDFFKLFSREILMGAFLGIILGAFSFIRARFIDVNPFIGFAVGAAVFISVIAANIIGTILPLLLKKLKIDPAVSAGPFISTIIDVTTLILYFKIAGMIFQIQV
jgi:magnesium transporter